jgi:hypothetical protein
MTKTLAGIKKSFRIFSQKQRGNMIDVLKHEVQNPQGASVQINALVGDLPTLFVLLRHFG